MQQHPQQCGDHNFDDLTEIQLSERNEILHTNSPLYADEFGYKIGQPSSLNVMENQQTYYSQIVSDNDNSEEGERLLICSYSSLEKLLLCRCTCTQTLPYVNKLPPPPSLAR